MLSSKGHVRDLIPKKGAVDPDNQFKMQYSAIADSAQYVKKIIQALSKADRLYWQLTRIVREELLPGICMNYCKNRTN